MESKADLIYDLIFSSQLEYKINIGDYIVDIYLYDDFITDIKSILKKSKVSVISSSLDIDSKTVIWKIKVRK